MRLKGTFTALVTPFLEDNSVDLEGLKKIIDLQIKAGITGIVPLGTTGETPTLSEEEQDHVLKTAIAHANKRTIVMAGTGTNSTVTTIKKTKKAKELGADCALVVAPYYNKPSQQGLYLHYKALVEETQFPVLVYNIKGRTGVNIETDTLLKISELPNIIGVKEASGDISQISDVIRLIKSKNDNFSVLSGDDGLTFPLMALGGDGVVSVASNLLPERICNLVNLCLSNKFQDAQKEHHKLTKIINTLFIETNPAPVKKAMSLVGMPAGKVRLPLTDLTKANEDKLITVLKEYELIK
jgi:4-hydroxy-tetrahydrodipicolinate synthase